MGLRESGDGERSRGAGRMMGQTLTKHRAPTTRLAQMGLGDGIGVPLDPVLTLCPHYGEVIEQRTVMHGTGRNKPPVGRGRGPN